MSETMEKMPQLADEVVREIMYRLPIGPLLRSRKLSTAWRDEIDSDVFRKAYLKHSLEQNSNLYVIVDKPSLPEQNRNVHVFVDNLCFFDSPIPSNNDFYSLDLDSLYSGSLLPKKLNNPIKSSEGITTIHCSCRGLLLLSNVRNQWHSKLRGDLTLWNPLTGEHKTIVTPPRCSKRDFNCGLWYDEVNDDFKVVVVLKNDPVLIYSLNVGSWKSSKATPSPDNLSRSGVYLSGSLHWVTSRYPREIPRSIVVFNLEEEEFKRLPMPPPCGGIGEANTYGISLRVLGGCLCAEVYLPHWVRWDHVEIWVMKKYGVADSWTLTLSMKRPGDLGFTGARMLPLVYSKRRDEILLNLFGENFVWANVKEDTTEIIPRQIVPTEASLYPFFPVTSSDIYVGSLVRLGSTSDPEQQLNP